MLPQKLQTAMALAGQVAPYWRMPLSAMTMVEESRCPTMGVDKFWRCYYNPAFVEAREINELGYVLLHELAHLLYRHHKRAAKIEAEQVRWNFGTDSEINSLVWDGLHLPDEAVTAQKLGMPAGMTAEWYYEKLPDRTDLIAISTPDHGSGVDGVVREYDRPMPGAGGKPSDQPGEGEADKTGHKPDTNGGKPTPGISDLEAEAISNAAAKSVCDALEGRGRGDIPAGVQIWANAAMKARRVDWRKLLRAAVNQSKSRAGMDSRCWARSRKRDGMFFPRRKAERLHVSIVVDTSGSMQGRPLQLALRETLEIARESDECDVVWCDSAATIQRNIKSCRELKPMGGGGTDMRVGVDAAMKTRPDFLIVLTDGDTPWGDRPRVPHLAVIVGGYSKPDKWEVLQIQVT